MIRIIGERGSGKTSELLKMAHENGYILVEPTPRMQDVAVAMAKSMGYNDVEILNILQFDMRNPGLFMRDINNRYLIDELDLCLSRMNVVGYSTSPNVPSLEKYRPECECIFLDKNHPTRLEHRS